MHGQRILAIDAGTTGVTGIVFDTDLRPRARAYREFAQGFPRPGWVEHAAPDVLGAVDEVLAELLAGPEADGIEALGITNQRETIFALERSTGRALRPGIVWQDRRTAARCEALREEGRAALVRERTGLVIDPYFSATKIEWMLAGDDELRRRAARGEVLFGTVDTLVIAHLTGNAVHATDPTNASRTMLFDIERREWSQELCALFGVDPSWLPGVRGSAGEHGTTSPERTAGRAIPILGVAGDQQSALFGQGCFDAGAFKATYGTGSFLLLNTGAVRRDSEAGLVTTLAVDRAGEPAFALEGSVFIGGAVVQWLRDQMRFIERAEEIEALARTVEDTGGVVVVPAFAGLGAPYWDPQARGAILGLTRGSERGHVARAALESIAFQNTEIVEILRADAGLAIDELLADGGATQNDLLMQMQADLAGLRVLRPQSVEATARGAAALAGLGAGVWTDPGDAGAFQDPLDVFEPGVEPDERERRLADWRRAVRRVMS